MTSYWLFHDLMGGEGKWFYGGFGNGRWALLDLAASMSLRSSRGDGYILHFPMTCTSETMQTTQYPFFLKKQMSYYEPFFFSWATVQ
jgi:hypothetical protein